MFRRPLARAGCPLMKTCSIPVGLSLVFSVVLLSSIFFQSKTVMSAAKFFRNRPLSSIRNCSAAAPRGAAAWRYFGVFDAPPGAST